MTSSIIRTPLHLISLILTSLLFLSHFLNNEHFSPHIIFSADAKELDCPNGFHNSNGGASSPTDGDSPIQVITKPTLNIATFNTYWLFNESRSTSYWPWKTQQQLQEHHENIQRAFGAIRADILNLVEVTEDCGFLHRLVEGSELPEESNVFLVKGRDTATKQNVALVSSYDTELFRSDMRWEYPLPNSNCGYCQCGGGSAKSTGVSKHYFSQFRMRYEHDDQEDWFPLLVAGVHFKAIPTDPPSCAKREAQATVIAENIRVILNQMKEDYPDKTPSVIIMGDFNDYDDSILDRNQNKPTSRTLRILREGLNLTNVIGAVNQEARYSDWWDKNDNQVIDPTERSLIDHILVSEHMIPALENVTVYASTLYPDGDLTTSDHWPIGMTLNVSRLSQIVRKMDSKKIYRCGADTSLSPDVCNSNGECIAEETCSCAPGYTGAHCESIACNGLLPNDPKVCSNGRGQCIGANMCNCTNPLYQGQFCEERTYSECAGVSEFDPHVCNGHGQCVSDDTCKCKTGEWNGDNCQYPICFELLSTHPKSCNGHGSCVKPQTCHCDANWAGLECEISLAALREEASGGSGTKSDDGVSNAWKSMSPAMIAATIMVIILASFCAGGICTGVAIGVGKLWLKSSNKEHIVLMEEEFELKSSDDELEEPTL